MARILAIDYGGKRTGIAVTDPLQIIATGIETIGVRTVRARRRGGAWCAP